MRFLGTLLLMGAALLPPARALAAPAPDLAQLEAGHAARRERLLATALGAPDFFAAGRLPETPSVEKRINVYGAYSAMLLRLGLHCAEANEVIRAAAEWFERPHPAGRPHQGEVDFTAFELARLYIALKDSPNLEEATREKIRAFFLTRDFKSNWESENHVLLFAAVRHLMGGELPRETFAAYGRTGAELARDDADWLKQFIRYRARYGWGEFDSGNYLDLVISTLLTLHDHSPDAELRALSGAMVNLLLADMAVDTLHGLYGGARGRLPEEQALRHGGNPLDELQYLYFGVGDYAPEGDALRLLPTKRLSRWEMSAQALFSSFRPMDVVAAIALRREFPYENRERKHLHNMADTLPVRPITGSIRKLTYLTSEYTLGAIQFQDPYPPGSAANYAKHQQHEWDFTVAGGPATRIFTHHPGTGGLHTYWRGAHSSSFVQTFQNKTVVLARWAIPPDQKYQFIHAYLPAAEFDEVREQSGWIFARRGDVFAALYLDGGHEWTTTGPHGGVEVVSRGARKASVFEAGHARDFGTFEDFRNEIVANTVSFDPKTLALEYASRRAGKIALRPDGARLVDGRPADLDYPTYDSPFLRSAWGSGVVELSAGGLRATLDFTAQPFKALP